VGIQPTLVYSAGIRQNPAHADGHDIKFRRAVRGKKAQRKAVELKQGREIRLAISSNPLRNQNIVGSCSTCCRHPRATSSGLCRDGSLPQRGSRFTIQVSGFPMLGNFDALFAWVPIRTPASTSGMIRRKKSTFSLTDAGGSNTARSCALRVHPPSKDLVGSRLAKINMCRKRETFKAALLQPGRVLGDPGEVETAFV
jgi:hypothetical protein